MTYDENGNILGDVMGALVNNGLGNGNWGGNSGFGGIWLIFFAFMFMFMNGGNGFGPFGNRNSYNIDPDIASKSDVAQTAAWQATQGDLRSISADIDRIDHDITTLGYNQLNSASQTVQTITSEGNATRQAITNAQMADMAQNNQNLLAILGQGNQISRDILGSSANTNQNISQQGYNTSMAIVGTGNNLNNTIRETSCQTQREIIQANGDTKLGLAALGGVIQNQSGDIKAILLKTAGDAALQNCQQTNAIQNTVNQNAAAEREIMNSNANMINNTVRDVGNQTQQGLSALGYIIQNKSDDIKTELLKATCAITQNDNQNTQKILDKMCQQELNAANQRNQELVVQNQALQLTNQVKDLQAGQLASAFYTINQIRPYPVPSYTVSSPYGTTGGTTAAG